MAIWLPLGPVSWKGKLQVASMVPISVLVLLFFIPCFLSTNNWKGLDGSGRARAGASSKACLSSWKASFIGSVHFQSLFSLVPSYRGLAFSANPKIHKRQYPSFQKIFHLSRVSWLRDLEDGFFLQPVLATSGPVLSYNRGM